ncbi:MAG: helix-turn-helix domain-containing protein [Acidobacteriota bacterium]|nr:helix-turn-helix domain-containing protein [Acidobacteriota bacterium]
MKLLTTKQAATVLGVSDRRVRAMIHAGQLPAHHLGRDYAIEEKVLHLVAKIERRPGRPPKSVAGRRGAIRKTTAKS